MVETGRATYAGPMASSSAVSRDTRPAERVTDRPPAASPLRFRRIRPSAVGWAALFAPGAVGGLVAGLTGAPGPIRPGRVIVATAGGALAGVVVARVIDEVRWRRSAICLELAEPDAVLDLLQAVRAEGVQADMIRAHHPERPDGDVVGYALRYRARDDRRVRAVLARQDG